MTMIIDKQVMLNLIIDAKRTDPETGSFAEWLAEYLVQHLSTLTQPNERLTWEELEKLKSSPVYIDVIGVNSYWALVRDINDCGVWLMTVDDIDDYGSHRLYGKTWIAYRRPPEGEEEEKHVIEITENL